MSRFGRAMRNIGAVFEFLFGSVVVVGFGLFVYAVVTVALNP